MQKDSTAKLLEENAMSAESSRQTDAAGFSLESSITRAVRHVRKNQPIIILLPGVTSLSFNLPTFEFDNDSSLYTWLKSCLNDYAIIIKPSDVKVPRVNDIADLLHLPVFVVMDIPDQEISGMAKSFLSHHDRISYTEIDMIQVNEGEASKPFVIKKEEPEVSAERSVMTEPPSTTFAKLLENHKNGKGA